MPHSADEIKEIKALIAVAKTGPVNIGICLGTSPEGTVIKMDRKRNPGMLAKQAKAAGGETMKLIAGRIEIKGKDAQVTCTEEPASTVAKHLKSAFKEIVGVSLDFTFVVDIRAADDTAPKSGFDAAAPEASREPAPAHTAASEPASAPATTRAQWDTAWAEVEPKFAALLAKAGAEAAKLSAVRDFAFAKAAAAQFEVAIKALQSLIQLMATVAKAQADAKPDDVAPEVDARALVQQLGTIKPQVAALGGPVGVKLTEMFQNAVALAKSGALAEAAAGLAKITAALAKIAASTVQAAARASASSQTASQDNAEPQPADPDPQTEKLSAAAETLRGTVNGLPGSDAKSALLALLGKAAQSLASGAVDAAEADIQGVKDGLTLQAEVDRLAPLVATAASQRKVADVNALTTLFNLVAETIPAANHAKAMDNLGKVAAMIDKGATLDQTTFEAEVPDDVRPFAASRLTWAMTRRALRAELGKLEQAISAAFSGVEGLEGAAPDLSPLFGQIEKLDGSLEEKLLEIVNSQPGRERAKLQVEARRLLDAYAAELSNPFFTDIDQDNGFVPVAVASTARKVMADLSKVLAA